MQVVSEGPIKITRATVDAALKRRQKGKRLIIRDRECLGLALIVNPGSARWECAYRPRGIDPGTGRRWPNKTVSLGVPEGQSPDDARLAANLQKSEGSDIAVGKDSNRFD